MEINTIRMAVEVLAFVAFLAIVAWAWTPRNRDRFDRDGRIPFDE